MEAAATIIGTVTQWSDVIMNYALVLVAVGTLSMALLEALKGVFKIKASFHERHLKHWIRNDLRTNLDEASAHTTLRVLRGEKSLKEVCDLSVGQIVSLATGVPAYKINAQAKPLGAFKIDFERALYTLPLEKMMGQIQEAVEIIIENPKRYQEAFLLLSATADDQDRMAWLSQRDDPAFRERPPQDIAGVSKRIQQSIQRQLDSFQLKTDYFWARSNQVQSVVIGAIALALAIRVNTGPDVSWLSIILLSALGGIAAPVAKDLVTSLSRIGRRE